jgi:hypothetical protein
MAILQAMTHIRRFRTWHEAGPARFRKFLIFRKQPLIPLLGSVPENTAGCRESGALALPVHFSVASNLLAKEWEDEI